MAVDFVIEVDDAHISREKSKARELRQSQWWKNRRGAGQCHYCKQQVPPRELTMDHIVPIVRGGHSSKSNVAPCCTHCNAQKKYLLPLEWEEYMASLANAAPSH